MKRFITDMKKYWHWIIYAGQSELKAEVANSYLNWLWWIIQPLCFMFIYAFVFGTLFNSKIDNIQIFVYIGIIMWDFMNRMLQSSVQIVRNNRHIVSKVYVPKYMLIMVKMYVNAVKLLIALCLLFILIIVCQVPFTLYMLWMFPVLLVTFTGTFALCTLALHFGVYVDDLANVVKIVLRIVFYLTGVFYDLESRLLACGLFRRGVAERLGHINPAASMLSGMRSALLYATTPNLKYLTGWFCVSLVVSIIGIHMIYKNENSYVKVI